MNFGLTGRSGATLVCDAAAVGRRSSVSLDFAQGSVGVNSRLPVAAVMTPTMIEQDHDG
jgi:hypothetical protein